MTDINDSIFYLPEEAVSRVRPEVIQSFSFYDVNFWPVTNKSINEYSKINDINRLYGYDNDVKHNEKLLLVEFAIVNENYISSIQTRSINHKLRIIQTVKDGTLICGDPSYPYLNLESTVDAHGIRLSRIYYDHLRSSNYKLRVLFDYYNPSKYSNCAKYIVRLWDDDLLNDIRTNKLQQRQLSSLLQLCVSAISTRDLEQYNYMNRTMILALKT
jgi:hypothetical protein